MGSKRAGGDCIGLISEERELLAERTDDTALVANAVTCSDAFSALLGQEELEEPADHEHEPGCETQHQHRGAEPSPVGMGPQVAASGEADRNARREAGRQFEFVGTEVAG